VLTGYCFQFSISGVANASPSPPIFLPTCQYCQDYNGTWLLVPQGPIDTVDQAGCTWVTCRPPVCCGYPSPVTNPAYRWTLSNVAKKDATTDWTITSSCLEVIYHLGSPLLSTGTNKFTLKSQPNPVCQYWPSTITVTGVPPKAISSQTKTARLFQTGSGAPNELGGLFAYPGEQWTPNNPYPKVNPNPYCNNTNQQITDWLYCSNFGFTIPASAWVTGISIQFKRWSDQANAASDNAITIGNIAFIQDQFYGNVYASGTWPTFLPGPNSDLATYGGQYDQWGQGGVLDTPNALINTPDMCFAISANATAMRSRAIHVDPSTCQMTVYYVSVPCGDNCCACPSIPSTGNPPSAYKITFPSIGSDCADHPIGVLPGCDCAFVSGQTFELPYNSLLSVPTYRCVYSGTIGYWGFSLTITNISPDARQFDFVAGTSSACALPNEVAAGGFFGCSVQASGPNLAISQCGEISLYPTFDAFNCYCGLVIQIGGNSHASLITVEAVPVT